MFWVSVHVGWNDGESRQSRENAKQKSLASQLQARRDKMPASIKMIFDS